VDAIAVINQRIAEIQSRITQLEPQRPTGSTLLSGAAFADVLGGVQQSTAGTGVARSLVDAGAGASQVNADNVPLAYLAYGNGKIPTDALSTISGTSQQLWPPATRSFEAMRSAAAADGVTIGITDSYRSYAAQVDVAARKGLYSQGGLGAVPGTSNHGWGTALDLDLDSAALAWMRQHGAEYGFVGDVPRESWHWDYHPTH
jgi:hypothetical protein